MPRQYFLMRHGKAADYMEHPDDFMRPLVPRGEQEVVTAAKKLANEYMIEHIVCSPAVRTIQTARIALEICMLPLAKLTVMPELYMGSFGHYLDALNAIPTHSNILIIGHNPSIGQIAIHYGLNQAGFKTAEIYGFESETRLELNSKSKSVFKFIRK